jgi:hypothetical protein
MGATLTAAVADAAMVAVLTGSITTAQPAAHAADMVVAMAAAGSAGFERGMVSSPAQG